MPFMIEDNENIEAGEDMRNIEIREASTAVTAFAASGGR